MGQAASEGPRLEDRYYLQKVKLGKGSFATVWRAIDRQSSRVVAIKQVDKALLVKRGSGRSDMEREISMMRACTHENLLHIFGTFEDGKSIYLALEYCDGGDFADKLSERSTDLEELEAARWLRQICSAIAALHSKCICHRDIKPANFLVAGGTTLKLSDFGLACAAPEKQLLREKCGTPAFMSPEQHLLPRSQGYWLQVDMWAAGVTMYMLLSSGRHPFLDSRGQLAQERLLKAELDFGESQGFLGFGSAGADPRFPKAARLLCRRMVTANPCQRIAAWEALRHQWLMQGETSSDTAVANNDGNPIGSPPSLADDPDAPQRNFDPGGTYGVPALEFPRPGAEGAAQPASEDGRDGLGDTERGGLPQEFGGVKEDVALVWIPPSGDSAPPHSRDELSPLRPPPPLPDEAAFGTSEHVGQGPVLLKDEPPGPENGLWAELRQDAELRAEVGMLRELLSRRDADSARRDQELADKDAELSRRADEVARLEAEVARRGADIAMLQAQVAELRCPPDAELNGAVHVQLDEEIAKKDRRPAKSTKCCALM